MMTVLDGRNSNKIPTIVQISEEAIIEKVDATYNGKNVFCVMLDNCFVPCVEDNGYGRYNYILCAAYKTRNGFNKWVNRQCR